MEQQSGRPIPFATVYIDGTTIGDITKEQGEVALSIQGVSLPARYIVSHLNYQDTCFVLESAVTQWKIALQPHENT